MITWVQSFCCPNGGRGKANLLIMSTFQNIPLPNVTTFVNTRNVKVYKHCSPNHCLSNGHNLCTGWMYLWSPTRTFTTLMRSSAPRYVSMTRPSGHSPRFAFGSNNMTTSPAASSRLGLNHFLLTLRLGRNSLRHLFQNCVINCWIRRQRFFGLNTSSGPVSEANCPPRWTTRK
jgi:hypothetical protein